MRIAAFGGGTPTPVTKADGSAGERAHHYPQFLPGRKDFLYHILHSDVAKQSIYVIGFS